MYWVSGWLTTAAPRMSSTDIGLVRQASGLSDPLYRFFAATLASVWELMPCVRM